MAMAESCTSYLSRFYLQGTETKEKRNHSTPRCFTIHPPSLWARMFDPTYRPKATLVHRAVIYTASNCQHHRQHAAKDISTIIPLVYGGRSLYPNETFPSTSPTRSALLAMPKGVRQPYAFVKSMHSMVNSSKQTLHLGQEKRSILGRCRNTMQ